MYLITDLSDTIGYRVEKGPAMVVHPSLQSLDCYPPNATFERGYDTAHHERIEQAMQQGLLNKNPRFNDRKPRYGGMRKVNGVPVFSIGPSHFVEAQKTNIATVNNARLYAELRERGQDEFDDPTAYFANTMALNAVLRSKEGYAMIFRRGDVEIFPHHWHVIGEMFDTDFSFWDMKDPSVQFRYNTISVMRAGFQDEVGIESSDIHLKLTGIADGLATTDITYRASTTLPIAEIIERWKQAKDAADHDKVLVLETRGAIRDFLASGEPITTLGAANLLFDLWHADKDLYASALEGYSAHSSVDVADHLKPLAT